MAEWAAAASCVQLHLERNGFKADDLVPQNVYLGILGRKKICDKYRSVQFPSQSLCKIGTSFPTTWSRNQQFKEFPLRCFCFGTLISTDSVASSSWIPVVDQALLMATVAFAYMAGVIPANKPSFNSRKQILGQGAGTVSSTPSGSVVEGKNQTSSEYVWDEVKQKLLNALDTVECNINLDRAAIQSESNSAIHPLSLYAISIGPRLRLLWATLQQLQEEVGCIAGINEAIDGDVLLQGISETIRASLQPICVRWLQEELRLENKILNKDMFANMFVRMKGVDAILQNIKRLGKEELYADLLFFLRFGFLRTGCLYDRKLITEHGADILEDVVITLADGIASLYLELISVDSSMFSEMNSLGLSLCALSTRTLQRLRNEVALKQWMQQNIESVISMYEDRFDLCTLRTQLLEEPNKGRTDILCWWKNFSLQKSPETYSPLRYVIISYFSLPMKRTKELRALTGWRYYFSLYLELSDILTPLARIVVTKVRNAISFFLISLIGRSLGLIYTGIRQALRWK